MQRLIDGAEKFRYLGTNTHLVSQEQNILHGEHDGFYWIRPEGKGTFKCSPAVKEAAEKKMAKGCHRIVVDLEKITGMDSTFMGMLAGLAVKLQKKGERLELAGVSEKSYDSLDDLGLEALLDIEPENAAWRTAIGEIRNSLKPLDDDEASPGNGKHILDCHRNLSDLSEENEEKFKTVMDVLGDQA